MRVILNEGRELHDRSARRKHGKILGAEKNFMIVIRRALNMIGLVGFRREIRLRNNQNMSVIA